ncbi:MAG: hypothetical protein P1S60_14930 [Anaerolineae bacterium]|nr:hypothetical protein [Anaerolineae bacterium]
MEDPLSIHRDFPPPGYTAGPSAIPGIEIYKPIVKDPAEGPAVVDFKCPQCQATTAYSVMDGGLRCAHCGYYEAPAQKTVGKGAEEFEFTVQTMAVQSSAQGWGESRKSLRCQSCQAETTLPPGHLTHSCPFCGSNQVLQQDAGQTSLRPRFLIPFKVDAEACKSIADIWLGSSWMTPKSLKSLASVAGFTGIFLPYWTFDAQSRAEWRAQVGHQETERYYDAASKSWKSRTKTVWRWESGRVGQTFDDVLVSGTSSLSHVLLDRVGDFNAAELVPYEPAYLAGFLAQAYDIPLDQTWKTARELMREATRIACRSQASTSQIRQFSMSLDFRDETWRYILVPVYVANYRFQDEVFQVMVNGQTGSISGQRPVDWAKVWLAISGMLAPGLLLGLLGLLAAAVGAILPPSLNASGFGFILAFILLIIGIIFAVRTFIQAREMDDV